MRYTQYRYGIYGRYAAQVPLSISIVSGGSRGMSTRSPRQRRNSVESLGKQRRHSSEKVGNKSSKNAAKSSALPERRRFVSAKDEAKWIVAQKWAPARSLSEQELKAARELFNSLDRDGSGAIDADELRMMMRQLGQDPSEEEILELIASVDEDDNGAMTAQQLALQISIHPMPPLESRHADGQIQLREFYKLYAQGLDTKGRSGSEDVNNVFSSMGGDPRNDSSRVPTRDVEAFLSDFGLEVNLNQTFKQALPEELSKEEFATLLMVHH